MASKPFSFDAEAVRGVAQRMDSAVTGITVPPEAVVPVDRFHTTAAVADGTATARTRITEFTTDLSTLAQQIRGATAQFGATEDLNSARLELL